MRLLHAGHDQAAVDLLTHNPRPTEDDVRHGLEGNLCRCTGYQNIVKAVLSAASEMRGEGAILGSFQDADAEPPQVPAAQAAADTSDERTAVSA